MPKGRSLKGLRPFSFKELLDLCRNVPHDGVALLGAPPRSQRIPRDIVHRPFPRPPACRFFLESGGGLW